MATLKKKGEALPAIKDVLAELASRRKKLDDADTQLSVLIKEAEDVLRDHFSIRVWADITEHEFGSGLETILAFGKHDGAWQLLVETSIPGSGTDVTPLLSCSRETRVRVFTEGGMEALIRGAVDQLDKLLAQRQVALEKASDLVRELGGVPF